MMYNTKEYQLAEKNFYLKKLVDLATKKALADLGECEFDKVEYEVFAQIAVKMGIPKSANRKSFNMLVKALKPSKKQWKQKSFTIVGIDKETRVILLQEE